MTESIKSRSSIADILLVISRHIGLILVFALICALLTILYVNSTHKSEYTSIATLYVPSDEYGGGRSDLGTLASQFGITSRSSSGSDISSATLYPEIVNSNRFAQIMLDKDFITEKYGKKLPLIAIFTYGENPTPSNIDTLRISSAKRVSNMVKFSMAAGFFIIEVTSEEPQFSKDFADTMLVELDKLQRKFKKQSVNEKIQYLNQKITLAKEELENNEEKLKQFRERNRNVDNSPALLLEQERLERDVQIQTGIFLTLKQQLELARIEEVQKSSFVQILDYPSLPIRVSNPIKSSIYFIGGILGLFIGIAISFLIEYFRNTEKTERTKLSNAKNNFLNPFKSIFKIISSK